MKRADSPICPAGSASDHAQLIKTGWYAPHHLVQPNMDWVLIKENGRNFDFGLAPARKLLTIPIMVALIISGLLLALGAT